MTLFSRSALFCALAALVVMCNVARADDSAPADSPEKAAQPAVAPGSSATTTAAASLVIEEELAAEEAAPPAPVGDERRAIGDYIRNHTREIRNCYETRQLERKTLHGKLVARFDIGPDGRVIGAFADGMGDRELSLCVVQVIRGWEFEKPQSGGKLRVGYPWVFTPAPSQQ